MVGSVTYTVTEVAKHDKRDDCWIIVDGYVYDFTKWAAKHPGGPSIIFDHADAVHAMHPNLGLQYKMMQPFRLGLVVDYNPTKLQTEFRNLRKTFLSEGLFKPNSMFYLFNLLQVLVCEVVGHYIALFWGLDTWWSWFACAFFLVISQAQAGWLQHDFGHLSVLNQRDKRPFWMTNKFWHYITISGLKGASSNWWRYRHNRHHAKPNVIKKDPDLANEPLFIFHENMVDLGMGSKGTPYQAKYWFIVGPPLITSLYFDFIWSLSYLTRTFILGRVATGSWGGSIGFYLFMRCFESMWFSWVISMNHFSMHMALDEKADWVTAQLHATQNVRPGLFNDWFTGHLNYQIEHHLFPSMPRHNYFKIQARVKQLCEENGLKYESKGLLEAFSDVVKALDRTATYFTEHKHK